MREHKFTVGQHVTYKSISAGRVKCKVIELIHGGNMWENAVVLEVIYKDYSPAYRKGQRFTTVEHSNFLY